MIHVVNFDFCNYSAVERFLNKCNYTYKTLANDVDIKPGSDIVLLPGVGSFHEGMNFLNEKNLTPLIKNFAKKNGRLVGICLGMQLFFENSAESPGQPGLGLIEGVCKRLPEELGESVPRVGWDTLLNYSPRSLVASEVVEPQKILTDVYFVHSYYCEPKHDEFITSQFSHGGRMLCASVKSYNIVGTQFHPEKSGPFGYEIFKDLLQG